MKVLITGPRGFIASHLIAWLRAQPAFDVVTMDRSRDAGAIYASFEVYKFDAVVHLATLFLRTHGFGDIAPLVESNLTFTTQLMECARQTRVRHVLTFGSYYEFPAPASLYAATKAAMLPILDYYASAGDIRITELSLFDTYGPGDGRGKILQLLIDAARSGAPLQLSPGHQQLRLLHVSDVCTAIVRALTMEPPATTGSVVHYAVTPAEALTLREIAGKVEAVVGLPLHAEWGARDYTPGVPKCPALPYPPLPGWTPRVSLEQGIREMAAGA